jgi:hypothetical protein
VHGVAELVLAGPQYAESHDIRLRVAAGGFGTVASPDLRIELRRGRQAGQRGYEGTMTNRSLSLGTDTRGAGAWG